MILTPTNSNVTEPQRHPRAPPVPGQLRHQYIIMRHGFSVPNSKKRIVSSVTEGILADNGLTDAGREQARSSAAALVAFLESHVCTASRPQDVVVASSPFSRAAQTAEILCNALASNALLGDALRTPKPRIVNELRERYFGVLDGASDDNYKKVWDMDIRNGDAQEAYGAESCLDVWLRVRRLITCMEERLRKPSIVILVSHGDTLQITQTGFDAEKALASHRQRQPLQQAEWRRLEPVASGCPIVVSRM